MTTSRRATTLIVVSAWLATSPVAGARRQTQPAGTTAAIPFAAHGAFVGISVPDVQASVRWYSETLGLRVVLRPPRDESAEVVVLEGGGLIVELMQLRDAKPPGSVGVTREELVHGIFKAGVIVQDFDALLAAFKARDVPIAYGPYPATESQRANVIIRDNAGNLLQFLGGPQGRSRP
jgi:catechol 2,3-dioxygenase-like lactoylglutathione lyase family enzyme